MACRRERLRGRTLFSAAERRDEVLDERRDVLAAARAAAARAIGTTERRKNRSSRKRPRAISSSRFLLVAAMTRTSTVDRLLRTRSRSTSPSCSTRSTFACVRRLMSPTSSRKIVPPSASSNLPICFSVAPVNEPFSCPNSSLSISSSGIAAQLTCDEGLVGARAELRWIARATSSLPTPLSPRDRAPWRSWARRARSRPETVCIAALSPTIRKRVLEGQPQAAVLLGEPAAAPRALRATSRTRSRSSGFSMKSKAPSLRRLDRGLDRRRGRR